MNTTFRHLEQIKQRVDVKLARYLSARRREALRRDRSLAAPYDSLRRMMLPRGKRLRPFFAYLGYRAAGGRKTDAILGAAMAFEFQHVSFLIHDDLFDHSDVRRGKPTVHVQFERIHRRKHYTGSPTDFGTTLGILVGDIAFALCFDVLDRTTFDPRTTQQARSYLDLSNAETLAGQYLDIVGALTNAHDARTVEKILEFKSAKYTIERPLQFGAVLAGAPASTTAGLSRYGVALGKAFQVQDDILGVFGTRRKVGKPVDSDIREGKQTLLSAFALKYAEPADRRTLQRALGNPRLTQQAFRNVQKIFRDTGALEHARSRAEHYATKAINAIEDAQVRPTAKRQLIGIASFIIDRER